MKKKPISILLILAILVLTFATGCDKSDEEQTSSESTRTAILQEFSEISEIPRSSNGDFNRLTKYLTRQIEEMDLTAVTDDAGNIMVEKPGSVGYESAPTTVIHTNLDMIAEHSPSIIFNKDKDPITILVDEELKQINANNTSLGASSGLGIATCLFVLKNSVNSGPIKVVFTVNGETDMSGAKNINPQFLQGDYLINLNNNNSEIIETGSAYSCAIEASEKIKMQKTQNKYSFVLVADGFVGGDAGIGAQNEQGNPIKFLAEVLALAQGEGLMFELNDFNGGDNIYDIPKTATATITVNEYEKGKVSSLFNKVKKDYEKKHAESDPDASLSLIGTTVPDKALSDDNASNLISFLYGLTDGKYNDKSHTTASSNIGTIKITNKKISMGIFSQGKIEASLNRIIKEHEDIAKISNIQINTGDCISGFYSPSTDFLPKEIHNIYNNIIEKNAETQYRPTRTELGFFQGINPDIQIVSIGPTIKYENTINEYASLSTIDIPATVVLAFLTNLSEN